MSEVGDNIEIKIKNIKHETHSVLKAIDWRLNSEARKAREELLEVQNSLTIDVDNPPKIVQIKAGNKEYTSVRRMEGKSLYVVDDKPDDSYESRSIFEVDTDSMLDGSIGLLLIPSGAECNNPELIKICEDEEVYGWELEHLLYEGVKYEQSDWNVKYGVKILVKRTGDNFYILGDVSDRFDRKNTISQIKPDNNGKLTLTEWSYYISENEMAVKRDWYNTRARFYVLVEGGSDKHKLADPRSVNRELKTATQIV